LTFIVLQDSVDSATLASLSQVMLQSRKSRKQKEQIIKHGFGATVHAMQFDLNKI